MSILVIEDDQELLTSFGHILAEEGFLVRCAASAEDALDWLHTHTPDLILLDLSLPGIDGVEFRARQLAEPRLAKIPVVVISAREGAQAIARKLAVDDFLAKPVTIEELIHVVQNRAKTVPRAEHNLRGAMKPRV